MTSFLRRVVADEGGLGLAELMMGSAITLITLTMLLVWMTATTRGDLHQDADLDALNDLRFAKAELVRELRFADGVLPVSGPDAVDVWIDHDESGGTGPDQPGEHVTWQILAGDLVRYEDGDPTDAQVWAADLVTASSDITVSGPVVDLVLTLDAGTGGATALRTIETQVTVRNG